MKKQLIVLFFLLSFSAAANNNSKICPVELVDFNVETAPDGALISWKTASEYQSSRFVIMRALFEVPVKKEYMPIDSIPAAGNSNSPREYEFLDESVTPSKKYYYKLKIVDKDGEISYSQEAFIDVPKVLFAEGMDFSAVLKEGTVFISWATEFEGGLDSFLVDKSTNGEKPEILIRTKALGDEPDPIIYGEYTDENISAGNWYVYSLIGMNHSGETEQLHEIMIDITSSVNEITENAANVKIYPNPAENFINVNLILHETCQVQIAVFTLSGRKVYSSGEIVLNAGAHIQDLNILHLPQGTYIYRIIAGKNSYTGRINVIR